jgi:hypothetical protein
LSFLHWFLLCRMTHWALLDRLIPSKIVSNPHKLTRLSHVKNILFVY